MSRAVEAFDLWRGARGQAGDRPSEHSACEQTCAMECVYIYSPRPLLGRGQSDARPAWQWPPPHRLILISLSAAEGSPADPNRGFRRPGRAAGENRRSGHRATTRRRRPLEYNRHPAWSCVKGAQGPWTLGWPREAPGSAGMNRQTIQCAFNIDTSLSPSRQWVVGRSPPRQRGIVHVDSKLRVRQRRRGREQGTRGTSKKAPKASKSRGQEPARQGWHRRGPKNRSRARRSRSRTSFQQRRLLPHLLDLPSGTLSLTERFVTGPCGLDKHQGARPPLINLASSHHRG